MNAYYREVRDLLLTDTAFRAYARSRIFPTPSLTYAGLSLFRKKVQEAVMATDLRRAVGPLDYVKLAQDVGEMLLRKDISLSDSLESYEPHPVFGLDTPTKTTETSLMKGYKFEVKHYMNRQCIEDMSDDEIIVSVAGIKADKDKLEKLGVESKAITKQLAAMDDAMTQMIEHLDGRIED